MVVFAPDWEVLGWQLVSRPAAGFVGPRFGSAVHCGAAWCFDVGGAGKSLNYRGPCSQRGKRWLHGPKRRG
ncbi:hypothetical protein GCM10010038_26000 [Glutamicibacter protophormiae]|nr:hypothetical protein GCM10010038_26000 [Glutamicibacter protophormiae]